MRYWMGTGSKGRGMPKKISLADFSKRLEKIEAEASKLGEDLEQIEELDLVDEGFDLRDRLLALHEELVDFHERTADLSERLGEVATQSETLAEDIERASGFMDAFAADEESAEEGAK